MWLRIQSEGNRLQEFRSLGRTGRCLIVRLWVPGYISFKAQVLSVCLWAGVSCQLNPGHVTGLTLMSPLGSPGKAGGLCLCWHPLCGIIHLSARLWMLLGTCVSQRTWFVCILTQCLCSSKNDSEILEVHYCKPRCFVLCCICSLIGFFVSVFQIMSVFFLPSLCLHL